MKKSKTELPVVFYGVLADDLMRLYCCNIIFLTDKDWASEGENPHNPEDKTFARFWMQHHPWKELTGKEVAALVENAIVTRGYSIAKAAVYVEADLAEKAQMLAGVRKPKTAEAIARAYSRYRNPRPTVQSARVEYLRKHEKIMKFFKPPQ